MILHLEFIALSHVTKPPVVPTRVKSCVPFNPFVPNKGEHLIRYYGCYSNKARGIHAQQTAARPGSVVHPQEQGQEQPAIAAAPQLDRRRWAMLIKRIYESDPLLCPQCGGTRDSGFTCEADPDFLEHTRREELDQPQLPWEP